jgi:hypothetical protein
MSPEQAAKTSQRSKDPDAQGPRPVPPLSDKADDTPEAREIEKDYPASAWDTSTDYGPRQTGPSDPDMDPDEADSERRFANQNIKGPDPVKAMAESIKDDDTPAPPGRFEVGEAASDAAADSKWDDDERDAILSTVAWVASQRKSFTTDPVWHLLWEYRPQPCDCAKPCEEAHFRVTKGMTGMMQRAAGFGIVEATREATKSQRENCHGHGQRLTIWRSLIYEGDNASEQVPVLRSGGNGDDGRPDRGHAGAHAVRRTPRGDAPEADRPPGL